MNLLCTQDSAQEVVLEGVRYKASVEPAAFSAALRVVTPRLAAATPRRHRDDLLPVGFVLGTPPSFDELYGDDFRLLGDFRQPKGQRVDTPCTGVVPAMSAMASAPQMMMNNFFELLVTISSDDGGAVVDALLIDYLVGEKRYTLEVDWKLALCGDAELLRAMCFNGGNTGAP